MNTITLSKSKSSGRPVQRRATELLDWLIDFLPGTIPPSAEVAILDVSEDVDALFYHRSELQKVLDTAPEALNPIQKTKLAKLDRDIREAALLLVGAAKGMLHRCREGRYERSHWWWYLDDILTEENLACKKIGAKGKYSFAEPMTSLPKVAENRTAYKPKSKISKR